VFVSFGDVCTRHRRFVSFCCSLVSADTTALQQMHVSDFGLACHHSRPADSLPNALLRNALQNSSRTAAVVFDTKWICEWTRRALCGLAARLSLAWVSRHSPSCGGWNCFWIDF
jgi:hypothetical protein